MATAAVTASAASSAPPVRRQPSRSFMNPPTSLGIGARVRAPMRTSVRAGCLRGLYVRFMRSAYVPAGSGLARYVDRIWAWEGRPDELPTLLPGTGAELVIQHGGGTQRRYRFAGRLLARAGGPPPPTYLGRSSTSDAGVEEDESHGRRRADRDRHRSPVCRGRRIRG